MFAVIECKGKQYKVKEGETILVDLLEEPTEEKVVFDKVLLISDNDELIVGKPTIDNATVEGEYISVEKGKKVVVFKMKRRKSSMKKTGHRQKYSKVKILSINAKAKPEAVASKQVSTVEEDAQ